MNAPIRPPSPENVPPQQVLRAILATDFRAFVDYVFRVLRPTTPFKPNWHIDAMAHKISQVASGEVKRLIITVPPRHLKSIIASVVLPAWYLGHNPSERVVCVSYSADLAKTHANDFRRVVKDPLYQAVFPRMRVERDTDAEIQTTLRGRRYATSIGGTLTGRGGDLTIIDDPLKPGDALSDVTREGVIEWYRSTLVTRPDDKQVARILVVMQRIHVDDLVGYLLESDAGFEVLSLPRSRSRQPPTISAVAAPIPVKRGISFIPPMSLPKSCGTSRRTWGRCGFLPSTSRRPNPPAARSSSGKC
jgi:hypothetical protein